jgi:hypothetical protein
MWQAGNSSCWAAWLISHLHHLGILPAPARRMQLWTKTFEPAVVGASMSAITAHNWDLLSRYTPYRDLCWVPGVEGLAMVCYAQHFSQLHAGTERPVYHNTPAWQWRPSCSWPLDGCCCAV